MEAVLRCNDLKCRSQLHDRAVVTTCSHIFCTQCADSSGLSRAPNANRQCPACGTHLGNPDDVVIAALNPPEDYKTSLLSGLSPSIIMECAGRGLAFYSYQSSQEIIYQEHLAKSLTDKYSNLNQQMDQLIHDANAQIKVLQDKIQAMQTEQAALETKNHELVDAFREKSRAQQQVQKLYQSLKAQVMASHVASAAGDEADIALQTARGDRFSDRLPETRTATASFSQKGAGNQQGAHGRQHNRAGSGSSGSSGQQRGGLGLGQQWNMPPQGHSVGRFYNSQPGLVGTSSHARPSKLPVLGGTRANMFLAADAGPYHASPSVARQHLGVGPPRNLDGFRFGSKGSKRTGGGPSKGPLG